MGANFTLPLNVPLGTNLFTLLELQFSHPKIGKQVADEVK